VRSAVLPDAAGASPEPVRPRLETVYTNPNPPQRSGSIQRGLFHRRDNRKVFGIAEVDGARLRNLRKDPEGRASSGKPRPPKRRVHPDQFVFDFDRASPPMRAFRQELERSRDLEMAPLTQRAAAALIDAVLVAVFVAILACSSLLLLRDVHAAEFAAGWPFLVPIPILVAIFYKVLWALFRKPSIGLQIAGLELRSLDGQSPSFSQVIVRLFAGWLSLGCAGLGLVFALVTHDRSAMHDLISQTFLTPAGRGAAE
jgi:uncharacterized RDD family membrane protein YckC